MVNSISRKIRSGKFSAGTRLPGQNALASEYNVSTITANRALIELQKLGLVERRERSGTYVRANTPALAEVIAIARAPLDEKKLRSMDFWHGISARAEALEIPSQIINDTDPILKQRLANTSGGKGVVLLDFDDSDLIILLGKMRVPHVVVGLESRTAPYSVLEDRRRAALALSNRMLERGCRALAFVGNLKAATHRLACEGFRESMARAGKPPAPTMDVNDGNVAAIVKQLLDRHSDLDGIIVMGGGMPFRALPIILAHPNKPRFGVMTETSTIMRLSEVAFIAQYSQVEAGKIAFDMLHAIAAGKIASATTQYPRFEIVEP